MSKYPDHYYSEIQSTNVDYTNIPTGRLDVARLLNGKPLFWKKEGKKPINNTLVLTDWTAEKWSNARCEEEIRYYEQALKDGFDIYVYQAPAEIINNTGGSITYTSKTPESVVKLTADNLSLLKDRVFRARIAQVKKENLIPLMLEQRISASKFVCIPQVENIQLSDVIASDHNLANLIEYIQDNSNGIIICDVLSKKALKKKEKLKAEYPDLVFIDHYTQIEIDESFDFANELLSSTQDIDKFLENIETINLENVHLFHPLFIPFLSKMPNLKTFTLNECDDFMFSNFPEESLSVLKQFENIKIFNSDVQEDAFLLLLNSASNLKSLKEESCSLPDLRLDMLSPQAFQFLEELSVCDDLDTNNLLFILSHSKNLKSLHLEDFDSIDLSKIESLEFLTHLVFMRNHFTNENLLTFFEKMPNLISVDVNMSMIKQGELINFIEILHQSKKETLEHLKLEILSINNMAYDIREYLFPIMDSFQVLNSYDKDKAKEACSTEAKPFFTVAESAIMRTRARTCSRIDIPGDSLETKFTSEIEIKKSENSRKSSDKPEIPIVSHAPKKSRSFTSDTEIKTKEFNVREMFWGIQGTPDPAPNEYRLEVYDVLEITNNPKEYFKLFQSEDLDLDPQYCVDCEWVDQDTYGLSTELNETPTYYAKTDIILGSQWTPLPSLSTQDHITHLHVEGINNKDVEIQYSKRCRLHFIRNKNPENLKSISIKIDFRLTTPVLPYRNGEFCSPGIQVLINKYLNYEEGHLNLPSDATGVECLRALQTQKPGVGACRHRGVAFKEEVECLYPGTKVNLVENDCHLFAEVLEPNGQWQCCDLGGYEAQLKHNTDNAPTQELRRSTVSEFKANESLIDVENSVFNTWKVHSGQEKTIPEYIQNLLNGTYSNKKTLVQLESSQMINDFQLLLQNQSKHTDRPVFYVDSPDDLRCSAPWIEKDPNSNQGRLRRGPGGALYEFLKAYKQSIPPAVLLVNWDNFKAEETIQFNSILDANRIVDGVEISESVHIIGLYVPKRPGVYKGVDFLSRFLKKLTCHFSLKDLKKEAEPLTQIISQIKDSTVEPISIDLYESSDWETGLLGQWAFKGPQLQFKEGILKEALKEAKENNRPLEIKNGLWKDEKFNQFWQKAKLNGLVDPSIKIQINEGYDWNQLLSEHKFVNTDISVSDIHILNSGNINQFFEDYTINENKKELTDIPGLLEKNQGSVLEVYLTQELTKSQWARLLVKVKHHQIGLHVHVAPGIKLPEGFPDVPIQRALDDSRVYLSQDIDYTVHELQDTNKIDKVIDISECNASDLLVSVDAKLDESDPNNPRYRFSQKINALLVALEKGEIVILKGHFNPDLVNALAPLCLNPPHFWINGQKQTYKGKCLLVTDPKAESDFNFISCHKAVAPSQYLQKSFIKRQTDFHYLKFHPGADSQDNYRGLRKIEHTPQPMDSDTKVSLSLEASQAFEAERLTLINETLSHNPFVFIAGKTGVGKSTFIKKVLKKDKEKYTVAFGEENTEAWARNTDTSKTKILFIDEANIDAGNFSAFEGLYNIPPGILVNGTYYPLDEKHKVIFAGNPLQYGNRALPSFIERHGNSIVFNPLTTDYLYHKVLKPVLKDTSISAQEAISVDILKVYQYICSLPGERISISPRELQMMAVLVASNPEHPAHYIHSVAQSCVPKAHIAQFNEWYKNTIGDPQLKLENQPLPSFNHPNTQFVLTPSRMPVYHKTMSFLKLRAFKQTTQNKKARYAGLGGLILEGEPGIGKSQFVTDILINENFKKGDIHSPKFQTGNIFYDIKASLSLSEKKAILIKAFHEGAVVIMDEMNSGPSMERLLNDLLMGYSPDPYEFCLFSQLPNGDIHQAEVGKFYLSKEGEYVVRDPFGKIQQGNILNEYQGNLNDLESKLNSSAFKKSILKITSHKEHTYSGSGRPRVPGFTLIATQNPISMEGRSAESVALERRLTKVYLAQYPEIEMQAIFLSKGVEEHALFLVREYLAVRAYGLKHGKEPLPTFRQLLDAFQNHMKAHSAHAKHPGSNIGVFHSFPLEKQDTQVIDPLSSQEKPDNKGPKIR